MNRMRDDTEVYGVFFRLGFEEYLVAYRDAEEEAEILAEDLDEEDFEAALDRYDEEG